MISKKGLPDFMKKMSDERLEELSEPRNFRQTPAKVNVEFDRKKQKSITIEEVEKRLLNIANKLKIDVMDKRVIKEYFNQYDKTFPSVITREVFSLYSVASDKDCKPINPCRKRIGDGFQTC